MLDRTLAAIEQAVEGMAAEDFERHPPGKWSAAGILEHLAITFHGTSRNLQKCLDAGVRRATRPTLRQRLGVLMVIEIGHFPTGAEAPPPTRPRGLAPADVLANIRRHLPAMDRVMSDCEIRFGRRGAMTDHPILGPLSLRQWRRFHWLHTRHHLKQVLRLKELAHGSSATA